MRLALVFGENNGRVIRDKLLRQKDNLEIEVFDTVPQLIDSSLKRGRAYDRIILLSNYVNNSTAGDLYNYWRSLSGIETQVVLMCKAGKEEELAKAFTQRFQSPVVTSMVVESSSMRVIIDSALLPVAKLSETYGVKMDNGFGFEDDDLSFETPTTDFGNNLTGQMGGVQNNGGMQQPKQQQEKAPVAQGKEQKPAQPKKKKGSFLSSIFGSRGDLEPAQNSQVQQNTPQETQTQEQSVEEHEHYQENPSYGQQQGYTEQQYENYGSQDEQQSEFEDDFVHMNGYEPEENSDFADMGYENSSQYEDTEEDYQSGGDTFGSDYAFEPQDTFEPMQSFGFDNGSPELDFSDMQQNQQVNQNPPRSKQPTAGTARVSQTRKPQTSQDMLVDVDFGEDTFSADVNTVRQEKPQVAEVDVDLGNMNIGAAEEAYRRATEQPKVIEKVVTKEVIREVGSSKSVLQGVLNGRFRKVIIVTGDRGTGVTSTAMNIVHYFSKKVPTLYFDCDTMRHGLLNYIDYTAFRNYEETHMNGTKLCKSSRAFELCAMKFDSNLDILSSDFSCDTSDDELTETQSVVAEVASEYNVVVVDCPIDKLHLLIDLYLTSRFVLCVEGTKRGMMNMLCNLEGIDIPARAKRSMCNTGTMLVTKAPKGLDMKKLQNYIEGIYEPSNGVDWMSMQKFLFNGKFDDKLLNAILEG